MHPQDEVDVVPVGRDAGSALLVRHLAAMESLSASVGAKFVALTYPFPGAHHQRVRDTVVAASRRGLPVLDLYGHFQATFPEAEWQAMRTPGDHVNARGYAEMGNRLHAAWFP